MQESLQNGLQGGVKKVKNAFSGIILGILFIIGGIILLIFNEKNNVKNIHDIDELRNNYIDVESNNVNLNNEGKLIATKGLLDTGNNYLEDKSFGVKVNAPILRRIVEVYQWVETSHTDDNDNTTYTYTKEWQDGLIDSNNFKEYSTHINPSSVLYGSETQVMDIVKVGDFTLNSELVETLVTNHEFNDYDTITFPTGFKLEGKYVTNSSNMMSPEIGDIRIVYEYAYYTNVSVLGMQYGNSIVSYKTEQGSNISHLIDGNYTGEELINSIEAGNNTLKWILRGVGTVLIVVGFIALFNPLSTLTSFIPLLGGLVGGIINFIAMLVGLAVSLMVIAISWIVFRPLLGIGLLVGAIALIVGAILLVKSKNKSQQPTQPVMNNYQ